MKTKAMIGETDVYIIAGQSNAAGYSRYDLQESPQDDRFLDGFPNILYAGNSRSTDNLEAVQCVHEWHSVCVGCGRKAEENGRYVYIGPELGMAQALSEYYNDRTGKQAAIVKYAAGGTSLLNKLSGENASEGNWVPPSYAEHLMDATGKTGGLYRNLLNEVSFRLKELRAMGAIPIIRAVYWMQGESDVDSVDKYPEAFRCFVSDFRKSFSEFAESKNSEIPFIVGTISCTAGGQFWNGEQQKFIQMQNELAKIKGVYPIDSSKFAVGPAYDDGCTDDWHWSASAQIRIGNLVGQCILSKILGQL